MVHFLKLIPFPMFVFLALWPIINTQHNPPIEDKIETFVNELRKCKKIEGMALSVVKDDRVVISKGFGFKNIESKEKADEKTLFGIAGLTNAFAAATLVKILTDKNITLSTPLKEYVNITFPSSHLNDYVTLEDILSHRTGLAKNNFLRFNRNFTRKTLYKFLEHFDILQDFRTSFIHNNIMYGLASFITELLSNGLTWEEAVSTHLLQPLEMIDTTFSTTVDVDNVNMAYAYLNTDENNLRRVSPKFIKEWSKLGGSGSILSSADDMTRWMRFWLNKGQLDGQTIMTPNDMETMFKIRNYPGTKSTTFMRPNIPLTISSDLYTLGWRTGYYRGFPIMTHTGATWGYKSMVTLFPVQKFGIFYAQIGVDDGVINRRLIQSYIADLYLVEKPWLNVSTACDFPGKSSEKKKSPFKKQNTYSPSDWDKRYDFVGSYSNKLWGNLQIELIKDELILIYSYGRFQMIPTENSLEFSGDGLGYVWSMKISIIFGTKCENHLKIASVTIPSFERDRPPTFTKLN